MLSIHSEQKAQLSQKNFTKVQRKIKRQTVAFLEKTTQDVGKLEKKWKIKRKHIGKKETNRKTAESCNAYAKNKLC